VAKYLCKASWNSGQLRLTVPKELVKVKEWQDVEFFMLEGDSVNTVKIWRFLNGQSLESDGTSNKS